MDNHQDAPQSTTNDPTATLIDDPPQSSPQIHKPVQTQRPVRYAIAGKPPKYPNNLPDLVYSFALAGYTDEQIALALKFSPAYFVKLRRTHPDVKVKLEQARIDASTKVSQSLFKRALGVEVYEERLDREGNPVACKKLIPGDVDAMQYWLNNRDPEHWRSQGAGVQVNVQTNVQIPDELWRAARDAKTARAGIVDTQVVQSPLQNSDKHQ